MTNRHHAPLLLRLSRKVCRSPSLSGEGRGRGGGSECLEAPRARIEARRWGWGVGAEGGLQSHSDQSRNVK